MKHGWLGNPCTKSRFEWENHRKTKGNHRTSGIFPIFFAFFSVGKSVFMGNCPGCHAWLQERVLPENMGVSENSVPLNPIGFADHYPY